MGTETVSAEELRDAADRLDERVTRGVDLAYADEWVQLAALLRHTADEFMVWNRRLEVDARTLDVARAILA
jgi:hypothetical protein